MFPPKPVSPPTNSNPGDYLSQSLPFPPPPSPTPQTIFSIPYLTSPFFLSKQTAPPPPPPPPPTLQRPPPGHFPSPSLDLDLEAGIVPGSETTLAETKEQEEPPTTTATNRAPRRRSRLCKFLAVGILLFVVALVVWFATRITIFCNAEQMSASECIGVLALGLKKKERGE